MIARCERTQHFIIFDALAHHFESNRTSHGEVLAVGVDDEGIARRQQFRVVVDHRLGVEQGLRSPVISAPMQKPRKAVAEIEPLEKPNLDQRQVHQAVEVPLLRIETSVEPDGVAVAHALLEQRHLVVEPPQLRNPDVAVVL